MADWEELIIDVPAAAAVWERPPLYIVGRDGGHPGQNQITSIVTTASGGTFTINPNGLGATSSISGSASAATVQSTLEAHADIEPGDVIVTGGPLGSGSTPVLIEWAGQFAGHQVTLQVNGSGTTGLATATEQEAQPPSLLVLTRFEVNPPAERADWITGADSEWAVLARDPLHENREITMQVRVAEGATHDEAFEALGQLRDKFAAAAADPDGIPMQWTPSGSARSVIGDLLLGRFTGGVGPGDGRDAGHLWLNAKPEVDAALTLKPYWRSATETFTSATTASTPIVSQEVTAGGDVPALGRLIVTDDATQTRRDVEWGYEGPATYDSSTSLLLDSDALTTSGYAGSQAAVGGSYDPNSSGNNVIEATALTNPVAMCSTGAQSHVGTFRVWGRFLFLTGSTRVRLAWRVGDGQYARNNWVPVTINGPSGEWHEVDLGTITIPEQVIGTQRWNGIIEIAAFGDTTSIDVTLDYLRLMPATNGYGRARSVWQYSPGVPVAYDYFDSITDTALDSRNAPLGGAWSTSGASTDFSGDSTTATIKRAAATDIGTAGRWAILGSTDYTDTEVSVATTVSASPSSGAAERFVVARWTDANNNVQAGIQQYPTNCVFTLYVWLSGSARNQQYVMTPVIGWARIRLVVYASGLAIAQLLNLEGSVLYQLSMVDPELATGGDLASGETGIRDYGGASVTRYYDQFVTATPAADPAVLFSGRSMQFRHDGVLRLDSAGTYYGRPPSYRGTRFLLQPGTGRVAVTALRADRDVSPVDNVTDSTTIRVGVTDRYLVVPRS